MATRRERLEAKLEKRGEWEDKARARSSAAFGRASAISSQIPFGQPILVGHHSERKARRDAERIHAGMDKGVEEHRLAEHHASKARGLEVQLDRTIFDDDPDAIERLEARIKAREESAAQCAAVNKAWRKGGAEAVRAQFGEKLAATVESTMKMAPWLKTPLSNTNVRAAIRGDKERIEQIKIKQARAAAAEAAPAGVLVEPLGSASSDEYVRVTFPEKPAREVLDALRAAGYRWGQGSWVGKRAALPECVQGSKEDDNGSR